MGEYFPQVLFHVHAVIGPKCDALAFEQGALLGPSRGGLPDAVHDAMARQRVVGRGLRHRSPHPSSVLRSPGQHGYLAVGKYFTSWDLPGDLVHVIEKLL